MNFIRRALKRVKNEIKIRRNRVRSIGKVKYFCIGRNKTGTTSIKKAFEQLGYPVGYQRKAEILHDKYYFEGNFDPIIKYCKSAQVFQDSPFSCPDTFKYIDKAFPGSKFILTVRDSPEQWYNSITRFHAKKYGKNGRIPTVDDLLSATYVRKGSPYNTVKLHGTPDNDPYNFEIMVNHYKRHNEAVLEYFKDRPDDLLVINLSKPGAYKKFTDFLGVKSSYNDFPWENKT
ncbi:sulfotransferase [Idiomarina sp. Sol25]|uniref:sulfotransferase n=1 Tax=Idiomarina sp. Sol25 TaxID=3064000 RepID=UPI00294AB38D|nr:sulfotransferase [Idiomarina sp. Sol25]MDV6328050.1 sulfotransferase [Idiomarina sp. Sol25]